MLMALYHFDQNQCTSLNQILHFGNISDAKTIQNLLADIDFLKLDRVKLVMDRGFYSEENINALYRTHYKFLITTKTSLKFVRTEIDKIRDTIVSRPHFSLKYTF